MSINGGSRRGKDTRDFPTYPAAAPKRPRGFGRPSATGAAENPGTGDSSSPQGSKPELRRALWRLSLPRPTRETLLPPGTVRAIWLGFQTWLVSWAAIVLLAVATWTQYSSLPAMSHTTWQNALEIGNGIYAAALGASLSNATMHFSLTPWGITLFIGFLLGLSLKVARPQSPWALAWGLLAFLLPTWVCLGFAALRLTVWPAVLVSLILAVTVFDLVGRRLPWSNFAVIFPGGEPWEWLSLSGRLLKILTLSALGMGVLTLLGGAVLGWTDMLNIWNGLHPGILGGIILVLGLLAYLPTILVWALSWLVGPGITVGSGTVFTPGQVVSGDLPPIPFLAWLPEAPTGWWPLAIPVVSAILTGILLSRKHDLTLPDTLLSLAFLLVVMLGGGFILTLGASGDLGPGRLGEVGPLPAVVYAGVIAWGVPFAVTLVLGHRRVGQEAARFAARIAGKDIDALPTAKLEL